MNAVQFGVICHSVPRPTNQLKAVLSRLVSWALSNGPRRPPKRMASRIAHAIVRDFGLTARRLALRRRAPRFADAWADYLPRCTEADFAAWRYLRAATVWKYAVWDAGCKMLTQTGWIGAGASAVSRSPRAAAT